MATAGTMDKVDFEKQEQALFARAEKFRASTKTVGNKLGIVNEVVDIYSDGIRMSGTVWKPDWVKPQDRLPAILLCHGWGGKRAHLDFSYAAKFAQAGFLALTFDYRGWGDSDGVVVPVEKVPARQSGQSDDCTTLKVRIVRKVIDPEWQLRDVDSALNYLLGALPNVDTSRVGIWGSSFGGGHALAMGAKDSRIKCIVCQIGSINTHANWVNRHPDYRGEQAIRGLSVEQTKGTVFPWTIKMPHGLDGAPNLPKVVFEHTEKTMSSLDNITSPTLILAAEKEELFRNELNSELVYERLKGRVPAKLDYLPGGHYDAYSQPAYAKGLEEAIQWFKLYLASPTSRSNL